MKSDFYFFFCRNDWKNYRFHRILGKAQLLIILWIRALQESRSSTVV